MGLWGDGGAAPVPDAAPASEGAPIESSGSRGLWTGAPATRSAKATSGGRGLWGGIEGALGSAGHALGDVALHPGRAVMNAVNAPGRASKSLLAGHGLGALGAAGDDPNRADIRHRIGLDDPNSLLGKTGTYDAAPQWMKGVADFAIDTATDPMTYVPGADLLKIGSRALGMANRGLHAGETLAKIPGVKAATEKVGESASALFNPHHDTALFSEHGQNVIDRTRNIHEHAAERAKVADDRVIAKHQGEIRSGAVPDPVKALMDRYGVVPAEIEKADPAAFRDALAAKRLSKTRTDIRASLQEQGLLSDGITGASRQALDKIRGHDAYFKDPAQADDARAALAKTFEPAGKPNALLDASRAVNDRLKAAFLALPGAHMANLANLGYNAYGPGVAARGLSRGALVALGRGGAETKALTDALEAAGAHNQYAPLYAETHRLPPLRAGARALNALQDKTLNATETGLRAEMLKKELARGTSAEDAVRKIHSALGSDPDTGMTKFLGALPLSQFPRFHTQTAIGSFLRTLLEHPGRVTTPEHALGMTPDSDASEPSADGSAHYHLSTPTAAGLKMMDNPVKYFTGASTLGKLVDVPRDTQALREGKGGPALSSILEALLGAVPGAELGRSAFEAATGGAGKAGESPGQDALSALLGGYFAKK